MSKMVLHDPFGHLKHKLWPKKRLGVKLTVWLPTSKSRESTWFRCVQVMCNSKKVINEGYSFASNLISIRGLHAKLWAPKVTGIPIVGISGLHLGVLGQNVIWMWASWFKDRVYYKGEGGGFPQVQAVLSLMSLSCSWLILAPKVLQLCINHFVLVLCRSVWVVDACHSS
jgi:hypothetical protein